MQENYIYVDVLILGSGIAGSTTAIELARLHPRARVMVITRAHDPYESNTRYAQGGIIATSDTYLVEDIVQSGDGVGLKEAAEIVSAEGPGLVQRILVDVAHVPFDRDSVGGLAFALEGGHRKSRVAKVADYTGKAIQEHLIALLEKSAAIDLVTGMTAIDFLVKDGVCLGASVFDQLDHRISSVFAKKTVLATGGASFLFSHTTNPQGARGDGIAMAYRAGAILGGMEFEQFHPTALAVRGAPAFLISEAVRGFGARLTDSSGRPFMQKYYPDVEKPDLTTRDKVSRAIYREIQKSDASCVYLDLHSYISPKEIVSHFPVIYKTCLQYGIDITHDLVPVAPAAHYFCGGITTDLCGRTSIKNLYAVGEGAYTGLHGANRLASTSLLEGLVFGARAARDMDISGEDSHDKREDDSERKERNVQEVDVHIDHYMKRIQDIMWDAVGVVRTAAGLQHAVSELTTLRDTIDTMWSKESVSDELIGLRNGVCTALLIAKSALANTSSVGCHWREEQS